MLITSKTDGDMVLCVSELTTEFFFFFFYKVSFGILHSREPTLETPDLSSLGLRWNLGENGMFFSL